MTYIVGYFGGANKYDHSQENRVNFKSYITQESAQKYWEELKQLKRDELKQYGYAWLQCFFIEKGSNVCQTHVCLDTPLEERIELNVAAKKKKKSYPTEVLEETNPLGVFNTIQWPLPSDAYVVAGVDVAQGQSL